MQPKGRGEDRTGGKGEQPHLPSLAQHPYPACVALGYAVLRVCLVSLLRHGRGAAEIGSLFFFGLISISVAAAARTNLPEPLCVWLTLVFPLPIIFAAVFSLKLPLRGFAQRSERQSCFLLPF